MERGRLSRRRAATAADWSATRSGPLKLSNMHPAAKNEIVHPAGEINRNMGVDGPKRCINFFYWSKYTWIRSNIDVSYGVSFMNTGLVLYSYRYQNLRLVTRIM